MGSISWRSASLVVSLVLVASTVNGSASTPESLTQRLLALNARYQGAGSEERDELLRDLLAVAAARQPLLATLIETDPGAALRVTVSTRLRDTLPAALQPYVEQEVELEGVLEVLVEDRDSGSRYLHFLQTPTERLSLHVPGEAPGLQTGTRVRVTGVRLGDAVVARSLGPPRP